MWYNNNDGAGLMYAAGGTVHIEKGFMSLKDFKTALKRRKSIDVTNTPMVFHLESPLTEVHRREIATHSCYGKIAVTTNDKIQSATCGGA